MRSILLMLLTLCLVQLATGAPTLLDRLAEKAEEAKAARLQPIAHQGFGSGLRNAWRNVRASFLRTKTSDRWLRTFASSGSARPNTRSSPAYTFSSLVRSTSSQSQPMLLSDTGAIVPVGRSYIKHSAAGRWIGKEVARMESANVKSAASAGGKSEVGRPLLDSESLSTRAGRRIKELLEEPQESGPIRLKKPQAGNPRSSAEHRSIQEWLREPQDTFPLLPRKPADGRPGSSHTNDEEYPVRLTSETVDGPRSWRFW